MNAEHPPLSRRSFVAGGAALAATLTGGSAARAAELTPVSTGAIPSDVAALTTYAAQLGYFKDNGLDVRVHLLASGPVIVNAVIGGSLDTGSANIGSLILARARGVPVKVVAPAGLADNSSSGDIIAVRKDSPIQSARDLNGKTVGIIAIKTMQHAAIDLWIDRRGGDSKSVKFFEIPPSDMLAALESRRVDAILPNEPITTLIRPNVRVIGNQWDAMKLPIVVFAAFAMEPWLQKNPEVAARFVTALRQTAVWANGHRRETAEILVREAKLDPHLATTMGRSTFGTHVDIAQIQPVADNLVRYGLLEKPVDLHELIWRPGKA